MYRSLGIVAASVVILVLEFSAAHAWENKGHETVGHIAAARLTDKAQQAVAALLDEGETLASAATWPDRTGRLVPDFNRVHYMSFPDDAIAYDQKRDCRNNNCIVEALKWFVTVAADKNAPRNLRRIALRYVAHLTGDIHQALHAGKAADRNGTDTRVSYKGQSANLHEFWDDILVELADKSNSEDLARKLLLGVTADDLKAWEAGGPETWAFESFKLSRSHAYNLSGPGEVSDEYVAAALPVIRRRLFQAGVRLGWLLNQTFK